MNTEIKKLSSDAEGFPSENTAAYASDVLNNDKNSDEVEVDLANHLVPVPQALELDYSEEQCAEEYFLLNMEEEVIFRPNVLDLKEPAEIALPSLYYEDQQVSHEEPLEANEERAGPKKED